MKTLLMFCVSAALLCVAISKNEYLNVQIPYRNPPPGSSKSVNFITTFNLDSINSVFKDLNNAKGTAATPKGVTILVKKTWKPPNSRIPITANFTSADDATFKANNLMSSKTSGRINSLIDQVSNDTVVIIVYCVDGWNVLPVSSGWTAPLNGKFKVVEDRNLSATLVEIPYDEFVSVIYAKPDPGTEDTLFPKLDPATIDTLRQSMTLKSISKEFPKVKLYTCVYEIVEMFSVGFTLRTYTEYGFMISLTYGGYV
ncbi:serpin A12-like [Hyperolius riggenbachi]|uniref:serpin A12-like n=1 Tax=Hyperolius riggenbachi TaxID=752182 RepID=UPI0035A34FCC